MSGVAPRPGQWFVALQGNALDLLLLQQLPPATFIVVQQEKWVCLTGQLFDAFDDYHGAFKYAEEDAIPQMMGLASL
ncbi:MAG: hypothetical protein QM692_14490, partial [Thermomicrobiales bacterium]